MALASAMRLDWLGRLDWRWWAGVLSVLSVVAGLVWYAGFRPGIPLTSRWVAGIVASAALLAVLLAMSRSRWNLFGYVGLVGVFAALFVRSQLRRGAFAPPLEEWTIAVGLLGGLVAVIALVRRSRRNPDGGAPSARAVSATALAVLVFVVTCLCIPAAKVVGDKPLDSDRPGGILQSAPITAELIPLPPDTEIARTESFDVGGHQQHVFVLASTIGTGRAALVELIVVHYTEQDWPLERQQLGRRKVYFGCRPVRGLLTWNEHCLEVIIDEGTDDRPGFPAIPGTVNLYIQ
jgi:hypothetical protein